MMATAKYQQIADRLRDQIDSGALQPGERLPSEPDLVRQFDASRNTVRLALALTLRARGGRGCALPPRAGWRC